MFPPGCGICESELLTQTHNRNTRSLAQNSTQPPQCSFNAHPTLPLESKQHTHRRTRERKAACIAIIVMPTQRQRCGIYRSTVSRCKMCGTNARDASRHSRFQRTTYIVNTTNIFSLQPVFMYIQPVGQ